MLYMLTHEPTRVAKRHFRQQFQYIAYRRQLEEEEHSEHRYAAADHGHDDHNNNAAMYTLPPSETVVMGRYRLKRDRLKLRIDDNHAVIRFSMNVCGTCDGAFNRLEMSAHSSTAHAADDVTIDHKLPECTTCMFHKWLRC